MVKFIQTSNLKIFWKSSNERVQTLALTYICWSAFCTHPSNFYYISVPYIFMRMVSISIIISSLDTLQNFFR